MSRDIRTPTGIDPNRPSPARIYDYFLGGTHNFAADREVGDRAIAALPKLPAIMRANRDFLRRAVRAVAAEGVDQFIDLGAGIPTEGTVHEIAREVQPRARVVYVDVDPVAVIHSRTILADDPHSVVLQADLKEPGDILDDPQVRALLDFERPICLLLVAVLHFTPDTAEVARIVGRYRDALAPGSYLVLSHATGEADPVAAERVSQLYAKVSSPLVLRNRADVERLVAGWSPVEPGLAYGPDWRPDKAAADPAGYGTYVAVARKP